MSLRYGKTIRPVLASTNGWRRISSGEAQCPDEGGVARVVADGVEKDVRLQPDQARVSQGQRIVERGEGTVPVVELGMDHRELMGAMPDPYNSLIWAIARSAPRGLPVLADAIASPVSRR